MADNYLEKHYADYESRKSAYRRSGGSKGLKKALWQIGTIVIPSVDDAKMEEFYAEMLGGVRCDDGVMFDNGVKVVFATKNGDFIVNFGITMASKYQYEQLIARLENMGVAVINGSVTDPSGNCINIVCP